MIQQISAFAPEETAVLEQTFRGRQILAYEKAYGGGYDFCRFFRVTDEETGRRGWLFLLNATLLICTDGAISGEEICAFAAMHLPFRIECPQYLLPALRQIPNYQALHRATFALTPGGQPSPQFRLEEINKAPRLQEVYDILEEGFPNLLEYSLWLTDVSHRCRHGMSRVLTYRDSTTLTLIYDWKDCVLVGQVATRLAQRGSGYARDFLRWTANRLAEQGKQAILYALDVRISFYREIGFQEIASEYVLERQDVPKEKQEKGALSF